MSEIDKNILKEKPNEIINEVHQNYSYLVKIKMSEIEDMRSFLDFLSKLMGSTYEKLQVL